MGLTWKETASGFQTLQENQDVTVKGGYGTGAGLSHLHCILPISYGYEHIFHAIT
jgi:hypothetical protein